MALQSPPPAPPPVPVDTAMTGEEAYLRRMAMSSKAPAEAASIPSTGPAFQSVNDGEEAYRRRVEMSRPPPKLETPPPFDGAAFAPPPLVPPPSAVPPATTTNQSVADLDARIKAQRDAAAAVAARLAAIAPPTELVPAPTAEPSTSSEKCVLCYALSRLRSDVC